MIKYVVFIIFSSFLLFISIKFLYIKNNFEGVKLSISNTAVLEKMGEPNDTYKQSDNSIEWHYYQFPIPEVFVITFKKNMVTHKYNSISP